MLSSEPCIRGHRSTKCNHANERLMVPVRKPGRPLSACPHPRDQACGCSGVTAAIPRKQTCHCGGDASESMPPTVVPRDPNTSIAEPTSPSRVTFKVQKTSARPQSSRKQSFDGARFERMDTNHINIVPFEQRPINVAPAPLSNGYSITRHPEGHGFLPQYMNLQPPYGQISMQPLPHITQSVSATINGSTNGIHQNGLEHVTETPLAKPIKSSENGSRNVTNGASCCAPPSSTNGSNGETKLATNGGSCCAPKISNHGHSSSENSISELQEITIGSCCSSKSLPDAPKHKILSNQGAPAPMTPQTNHQVLALDEIPFDPTLYPQYFPQATVFTYPSTYGSFQNPLQPSAWRQSVRAGSYINPQFQSPILPGVLPFTTPTIPKSNETIHTCSCGDTCQCIGCAAHPYNDATQDYVRSAWASMAADQPPNEIYTNGHGSSNGNGNSDMPTNGMHIVEPISSPTANTPSSAASGNGEDQSLSASDFFFVTYPFTSEGCGGDTQSCPCGEDCQCLGCEIHNGPSMPCEGEKEACPCGDECECLGCEIHNGRLSNVTP